MESTDFTAANWWAFNSFAEPFATGVVSPPIFIGFEMDSVTPGSILSVTIIPIASPAATAQSPSDPISLHGCVSKVITSIQYRDKSPFSLIAFAGAVRSRAAVRTGQVGEGVRMQVNSVDKALSTVHQLPAGRNKLVYSPLRFVISD